MHNYSGDHHSNMSLSEGVSGASPGDGEASVGSRRPGCLREWAEQGTTGRARAQAAAAGGQF